MGVVNDKTPVVHQLPADLTDGELMDMMRQARDARQAGSPSVTCCISGCDGDPRELKDIPEVRDLCKRLVSRGYVSFLDVTTTARGFPGYNGGRSLGAWEVWLLARGEMHGPGASDVDVADLLKFVEKDLHYLNTVADDHLTAEPKK